MPDIQNNPLIAGLLRPGAYNHPTQDLRLVETHCAWVLLTGEYAYKVKKPVDFGFLDFSTLEKRRHYCDEEIRLNRRFAPQIYLEVVTIGGTPEEPRVGAGEPALEYAVRMRQFPDGALLSQLAERHRLEATHIDQLVEIIGCFHRDAERAAADTSYGEADHVHHWVRENFEHIRPALHSGEEIDQLEQLRQWSEDERTRLAAVLQARKRDGFVRECHGDLHLGNITLIDGQPTPFDCIEFNAELRWIDVVSEVAFLIMDLDDRGYSTLGHRFLNDYLQLTGDYAGLKVLPYYLVYRALVRAKVAILRRAQTEPGSGPYRDATLEYHQYAQLATGYLSRGRPTLLVTRGLSGSGKSTLAHRLCEAAGMVQLRSDVERKRLAGLGARESSSSQLGGGLYTQAQTRQTYERLATLAGDVLQAGYSVIVDATFLLQAQRERFRQLADKLGTPFIILDCEAPEDELQRRILARAAAGRDASEAGLEVLRAQRAALEPLSSAEVAHRLRVDSSTADVQQLGSEIASRCAAQPRSGASRQT